MLRPVKSYGESTAFYPSGPGVVLLGVFLEPCSPDLSGQGMIKFKKKMSASWQVEAIQPASSRRLPKAAPSRRTRKWPVRCVAVGKRNWEIGTGSFRLIH